jgi:hypothetical protein
MEFKPQLMDTRETLVSTRRLLIDDLWGINIPKRFKDDFEFPQWEIDEDDYQELKDNDNPHYWDAWETLLSKARHRDQDGKIWTLEHNEGLWAIREDHEWENDVDG